MKRTRNLLNIWVMLMVFSLAQHVAAAGAEYALGSGDIISIHVYGEPDLSFEKIRLTDQGTFTYPFLGEVRAKGRTVSEVAHNITGQLKGDYLVHPKVTVQVVQYRDFFVNGEVRKPGGYPFIPGLTLRKAVALAGGLAERASQNKIYLIREGMAEDAAVKVGMDASISPGDIITVEQSFF